MLSLFSWWIYDLVRGRAKLEEGDKSLAVLSNSCSDQVQIITGQNKLFLGAVMSLDRVWYRLPADDVCLSTRGAWAA